MQTFEQIDPPKEIYISFRPVPQVPRHRNFLQHPCTARRWLPRANYRVRLGVAGYPRSNDRQRGKILKWEAGPICTESLAWARVFRNGMAFTTAWGCAWSAGHDQLGRFHGPHVSWGRIDRIERLRVRGMGALGTI